MKNFKIYSGFTNRVYKIQPIQPVNKVWDDISKKGQQDFREMLAKKMNENNKNDTKGKTK